MRSGVLCTWRPDCDACRAELRLRCFAGTSLLGLKLLELQKTTRVSTAYMACLRKSTLHSDALHTIHSLISHPPQARLPQLLLDIPPRHASKSGTADWLEPSVL